MENAFIENNHIKVHSTLVVHTLSTRCTHKTVTSAVSTQKLASYKWLNIKLNNTDYK